MYGTIMRSLLVLLLVMLLGTGSALAQGSGPAVDWWVMAGGGAPSGGGSVTLYDTIGQPLVGAASGGGSIGLAAGYWASCAAAAAAVPDLAADRDDDDVVLTWDPDPANAQYEVWITTDPYFDPDDPGGTTPIITTDTTYTDTGAAGSPTNHFYIVRGLNACGAVSASSERRGEFTFRLTRGSP